jgi:hypothetical protein
MAAIFNDSFITKAKEAFPGYDRFHKALDADDIEYVKHFLAGGEDNPTFTIPLEKICNMITSRKSTKLLAFSRDLITRRDLYNEAMNQIRAFNGISQTYPE